MSVDVVGGGGGGVAGCLNKWKTCFNCFAFLFVCSCIHVRCALPKP